MLFVLYRKRFRSANELYLHTCQVHCPDNIDPNAEIYCQWGDGPNLCDNVPRKRFSLMTHMFDRHLPLKALKQAVYRRIHSVTPQANTATSPVTIIKNPVSAVGAGAAADVAAGSMATAAAGDSTVPWPTSSPGPASAAMQAIKRHAMDFANPKELMDENEGPVTKSIRLTAALILRNLVNYTGSAKRLVVVCRFKCVVILYNRVYISGCCASTNRILPVWHSVMSNRAVQLLRCCSK